MLNFKSWFKPKPKPEEPVQAATSTTKPFDLNAKDLAIAIASMNRPNKWQITRMAAQGMAKSNKVGGNDYPPNWCSEKRRARRLRQIAKGIIQVTEEAQTQEVA